MSASHLHSDKASSYDEMTSNCSSKDHYQRGAQQLGSSSPLLSNTFSDITLYGLSSSRAVRKIPGQNTGDRGSYAAESGVDVAHRPRSGVTPHLTQSLRQISSDELAKILHDEKNSNTLILDLRSSVQFQTSRIKDAINIAIPPILLKRPIYTIEKMAQNCEDSAKAKLLSWFSASHIVVYDSDSYNIGSGTVLHQIAMKFATKESSVEVLLLKGGFAAVVRDAYSLVDVEPRVPERLDKHGSEATADSPIKTLGSLFCGDSARQGPVNPFYNNIRQNQDLIGGVGDPIPLQIPALFSKYHKRLPKWLRELATGSDGPRIIAEKFLKIEVEEQRRMQGVLNAGASGSVETMTGRHSVAAAVERGDKNRYNNIWPFENARVRLKTGINNQCGYINASYLHAEDSTKYYIATQGPLPSTTKDFWQMIWENEIRTIVMLTRTVEGGQNKCHTYWKTDELDSILPYNLQILEDNENKIVLSESSETSLFVRKIRVSMDSSEHIQSRLVTHIQFADWPDFHVIQPQAILTLLTEVQKAESTTETHAVKRLKSDSTHVELSNNRPVLSHCSAGCGRTGVFCTVDTVVDLVTRQLKEHLQEGQSNIDDCASDLIEETVRAFRDQRISMVQT